MMEISSDPFAVHLGQVFAATGHQLFLVGGAVRDTLLGHPQADLDFATDALPEATLALLSRVDDAHPYRVGEQFGTIGARVGLRHVEITTYRSDEQYVTGSRKPSVQFGTTLLGDLTRRDFTVNAMGLDPLNGQLIDPLDGRRDLLAGVLRAVGRPGERFREDPLRLLRAVRFAARLGFSIEPRTWEAMQEQAATLIGISRERIRDEYSRILTGSNVEQGLTLLRDSGLMETSVPQLLELTRMADHGPRHPLSLWDHTLRVVQGVEPDLTLRWAALLHDIAKPETRTLEADGRIRFFHHEDRGAFLAREILAGLRYPGQVVDGVSLLVETHMQIHAYQDDWSDGAVRRLLLRLGPLMPGAIDLSRADASGHSNDGTSWNAPKFVALTRRIEELEREPVEEMRSPLSGDDLMRRFELPPGAWIRPIKDALSEEVLEGRLRPHDREAAWKLAEALAREAGIA